MDWHRLADNALNGNPPTPEQALAVLNSSDDELLRVLDAAFEVRRRHHGRDVRIHVLQNAKSGVCPEDCGFCSQSLTADSGVERYRMQTVDELVAGARRARSMGAVAYCMVTATRGPSSAELSTVCEAVRRIKGEMKLSICTSLGLLTPDQAGALAEAGVDRFNHNIETSRRHFDQVVSTHSYDDRLAAVRAATAAGMQACCGGILGMGEDGRDRVDMAFELAELRVASIPINFLDPRPGTALADRPKLAPSDALRALAMFRFVNPSADIRVAGGREAVLGAMQPLALYPANSIFAQGYLTTDGQGADADVAMIEACGFTVAEVVVQ